MTTGICSNIFTTTMVCIDKYEECSFGGRFYNPYMKKGGEFKTLMQMLLQIEQMLDIIDSSQDFIGKRSFADSPKVNIGNPFVEFKYGKLATFTVKVLFRQNTSWQGSITWLEWGEEQSFRSVLELIYLMDNALNKAVKQAV